MVKIIVASIMLLSKKVDACIKNHLKSIASGASHRLGLTANSARFAFFSFFRLTARKRHVYDKKNNIF